MKKTTRMLCLLLLPLLCCSCGIGSGSEPEQIYTASAVGFDAKDENIRMCIEVPISREGERESMETKLFSGEGKTVEEALRSITVGLSREISFAHCATLVLGESLRAEQSDEIFSFAESGADLPIAATVVVSPNAEALLSGKSLSALAVGYEIPSVLQRVKKQLGVEIQSRVYELRSNHSQAPSTVFPRFSVAEEENAQTVVFEGLALLKRGSETVYLSDTESVYYALLSNQFKGTDGTRSSFGGLELRGIKSTLALESTDPLNFALTVRMRAAGRTDETRLQSLKTELEDGTEALFIRLRDSMGTDVFALRERAEGIPAEWSESDYRARFVGASLRVECLIEGEEKIK